MTRPAGTLSHQGRYAIYFTPRPDSALTARASGWLGRDPYTNEPVPAPALRDITPDAFDAATTAPRQYGFHATLAAPFTLRPETGANTLEDTCRAFAKQETPFTVTLAPRFLGPFLALLAGETQPLGALAQRTVETFAPYQTPFSPEERDRRLKPALTERQKANVDKWGYPYVMNDFIFHMTLTGPLPAQDHPRFQAAARNWFAPALNAPVPIDGIALFHQPDKETPFTVARYFPFAQS